MISATEALERLREGNRRFASGIRSLEASASRTRREELTDHQEPFAVVVGCSDSRVPLEIVFDQGLGDLFVVRIAGNVVAPSQTASVEFAADRFGTRLVVVLGHTGCGAIQAALEQLEQPIDSRSSYLDSIVGRIRTAIEPVLAEKIERDHAELLARAVRANVCASTEHLRHESKILKRLIKTGGLVIVGAEYSLETGLVDFFENPLEPPPKL